MRPLFPRLKRRIGQHSRSGRVLIPNNWPCLGMVDRDDRSSEVRLHAGSDSLRQGDHGAPAPALVSRRAEDRRASVASGYSRCRHRRHRAHGAWHPTRASASRASASRSLGARLDPTPRNPCRPALKAAPACLRIAKVRYGNGFRRVVRVRLDHHVYRVTDSSASNPQWPS